MRDWVAEWVQEGRIWLWQYKEADAHWRGWHIAADPSGCRSFRNLLDRMNGGDAVSRKIALQLVPDILLQSVGHTQSIAPQVLVLEIEFLPGVLGIHIQKTSNALKMTIGNARVRKLAAAFGQVEIGHGDFTLVTEIDSLFFWWPPRS